MSASRYCNSCIISQYVHLPSVNNRWSSLRSLAVHFAPLADGRYFFLEIEAERVSAANKSGKIPGTAHVASAGASVINVTITRRVAGNNYRYERIELRERHLFGARSVYGRLRFSGGNNRNRTGAALPEPDLSH